ncbi:MAG: hypothetical protein KGL39_43285 [Patescibacteria group bacterium]|nr:hypothetical protein [Patescibacteria group bacterium]
MPAKGFRQMVCKRGHPRYGDNAITDSRGYIVCRACKIARIRAWQKANREKCRVYERAWRERKNGE